MKLKIKLMKLKNKKNFLKLLKNLFLMKNKRFLKFSFKCLYQMNNNNKFKIKLLINSLKFNQTLNKACYYKIMILIKICQMKCKLKLKRIIFKDF